MLRPELHDRSRPAGNQAASNVTEGDVVSIVPAADVLTDVDALADSLRGYLVVQVCQVQYRRPGELSSHIDTFPAAQVRTDSVDRGDGRGQVQSTPGRLTSDVTLHGDGDRQGV